MRPDDLTIAIHEAGHAVVGFAVGLQVARVSIIEGDHSWARASVESGPVRTTRDLERQLLADVAGCAAEEVVLHTPWAQSAIGQVDLFRARDVAAAAARCHPVLATPWVNWAADRCLTFLRQRSSRRALDHLAMELLSRRELDGADLLEILSRQTNLPAIFG